MAAIGERLDSAEEAKLVMALGAVYPSMLCGLNVAQYRALRSVYTVDKETGRPPAINIISFANGVGKTHLLVLDIAGWTLGPGYLYRKKFPVEAIEFYTSLAGLRDTGMMSLRLVCTADDAKEGGSLVTILKELIPTARLTAKDQMGCYRQIDIPHPQLEGVVNHIAIKTFVQSKVAHSGSTCQRVWINEPLPAELVGETVGRIRSKKGGTPGSILMCATIVDGASWIEEFEDDPQIRLNHQRGHIYENCWGEDVTDDMAAEVYRTIGVKLEKGDKGGYVTGGVLERSTIEIMCASWRAQGTQEYEARKCGAPMAVGGRVYPTFKREVHVVDNYAFNADWPTFMVADPHSAKPTFAIWAQLTPMNRLYVFEEWPNIRSMGNYEDISKPIPAPQECETWRRIEAGYGISPEKIVRIGDPNRFREPDNFIGGTMRDKYTKLGFRFNINVNDDLDLGHKEVLQWLCYDELRYMTDNNDVASSPKLFIVKNCGNVINALRGYSFKMTGAKGATSVTEKVSQKYKDPADVVRYLVMWNSRRSFEQQSASAEKGDYERFIESRNNPKAYELNAKKYGMTGRAMARRLV